MVFIVGILIIQFAIRVPPDSRRILSITMGIVLIFREVWKTWYIYQLGNMGVEDSPPLHLAEFSSSVWNNVI